MNNSELEKLLTAQRKTLEEISKANAETEKRLAAQEKALGEQSNSFDRHLKMLTIIFSSVTGLIAFSALLLSVLGVVSKLDIDKATAREDEHIERAITDMKQQFKELAGDSLKNHFLLYQICKEL